MINYSLVVWLKLKANLYILPWLEEESSWFSELFIQFWLSDRCFDSSVTLFTCLFPIHSLSLWLFKSSSFWFVVSLFALVIFRDSVLNISSARILECEFASFCGGISEMLGSILNSSWFKEGFSLSTFSLFSSLLSEFLFSASELLSSIISSSWNPCLFLISDDSFWE